MHILQLFMLLAGVVTILGLVHSVREFVTGTLKDLKNGKF